MKRVALARVVAACRKATRKPLITKLSPNQTDIAPNARRCIEAGTDAFSVINTLMGMAIDIESRTPVLGNNQGGLSGPAIKPVALLRTHQVAQVCRPHGIPIIGQGGITSVEDALEFLIAGATAVGIGTALFYTITGKDFVTTGSLRNVLLTPKMGATDQTYIVPSGLCTLWNNDSIIFSMPSGLDARNYSVRVETDNGTSNLRVFTLTGTQTCVPCPAQTPVINSIEPPVGTDNATVVVRGQDFGDRHSGDRDVLFVQGAGIHPAPIISWKANEIRFRFPP